MLDGYIPNAYMLMGMSKLALFLQHHGIRQSVFAGRVGTSQATVSKLVNGDVLPSLSLAVRIERETHGEVPATSWVPEVGEPGEDAA